jgi:hypothetical protein
VGPLEKKTALFLGLLVAWATAPGAHAVLYFFDFGGGVVTSTGADDLLGASTSFPTPYGRLELGTPLSVWSSGEIQFGLQTRSFVRGGIQLIPLYPTLRFELWDFGLAASYTPWVWTLPGAVPERSLGTQALLIQVSYLFPITPEIAFGLETSWEKVSLTASTQNPATHVSGGVFFRLFGGKAPRGGKASSGPRDYRGWRYPYGVEIRN